MGIDHVCPVAGALSVKIIYFIDHLRPDGTQFVLTNLVKGLAERGHHQSVVCLNNSWDDVILQRLREGGAQVRIVGKVSLVTGIGIFRTWWWLRQERFDVAVTMLFISDVIGRSLAYCAQVSHVISSIRARNINYKLWQRWLLRQTMHWADVVVLNSDFVREFAIKEEGVKPEQIRVIPNGVNVEDYKNPIDRLSFCNQLSILTDEFIIGSVGRLTYQKGYDILIKAFASIKRRDIHLVLVGEGEEEISLRRESAILGVDRNVHFLGFRRDVKYLFGAFDIYIQPSRWEGMPNSLIEAMAAGCPIIATDVDGNRELVEDGVHGWLTSAEDPDALANDIKAVINDPSQAQLRASAAQYRVNKHFQIESTINAWEKALMQKI